MYAHRDSFVSFVANLLILTVPVMLVLEVSGQNVIPEFKTSFDDSTKGNAYVLFSCYFDQS